MKVVATGHSRILRTRRRFNIVVREIGIRAPDIEQPISRRGSIVLVNGAFASTRATRAIWSLLEGYDLVLYDLPHVGESKPHNDPERPLTLADEVEILAEVAALARPDYVLAMSWGGATALLALAQNRLPVEKAIVCSFSDRLTPPMRELLVALRALLAACRWTAAADFLTETLGARLHPALQRANRAYLEPFLEAECAHVMRHIEFLLPMDRPMFSDALGDVAADLLFINGERDVYAPSTDAARLAKQIAGSQVLVMPDTGHFLGVESKAKGALSARAVARFLEGAWVTPPGRRTPAAAPPIRAGTG